MAEWNINVKGDNNLIGTDNVMILDECINNKTECLEIFDKNHTTLMYVSLSWIHEYQGPLFLSTGSLTIKINIEHEDEAATCILRENEEHPEIFHYLVKQGFGIHMYLVSVQEGSVFFEIKTDNFETVSSLVTALKTGTFKCFVKELFKLKTVYDVIKGKTLKVFVQFIIPEQLTEVESCVGIAKAAVREIIELDKQERRQKARTTEKVREVADFMDRTEEEENRRRRNSLLATAVVATGLAFFTFGASLAAGVAAAVVTVGMAIFDRLQTAPVQERAEECRKEYVEAVSKYKNALKEVKKLKERDNPVVLSLLDEIDEESRHHLLESYLKNPRSVTVKDAIEIQIEQETYNLEQYTLLQLLWKILNIFSSNTGGHTREMATKIENFQLLEAR